ncbi:MAG: serine protease [Actinomycetota bacterium]|nr:serine protease [Actinomycetota bacterium]
MFDEEEGRLTRLESVTYPSDPTLDVAFLPNALKRTKAEFLPLLQPSLLNVGEDVYSFGYFLAGVEVEEGYFSGRIVNFTRSKGRYSLTLPFPVIEGLSGSPLLTYHNGPKVVGLAYGSRSSRILASEVIEVDQGSQRFKETVNRIIEFGLAYHVAVLVEVINELQILGAIVSDERVPLPGLA